MFAFVIAALTAVGAFAHYENGNGPQFVQTVFPPHAEATVTYGDTDLHRSLASNGTYTLRHPHAPYEGYERVTGSSVCRNGYENTCR